jgi:hypothetical protein
MIVILKNIPENTTIQVIKDFLMPVIKGHWLRKAGQIENVSILSQKNIKTHLLHYHGLVEIQPDIVANRVIKQLNGKIILGKHIYISQYYLRDWHNDRRFKNKNIDENKRGYERRGHYKEVLAQKPVSSISDTLPISNGIISRHSAN